MADFSPISLAGQANAAGDERLLHFEEWAGDVFANYTRMTPALNFHMNKTVQSGKRHTFNEIGDVYPAAHAMGTELLGQSVSHGERHVDIETNQIIADVFSPNADQMLAIYDERSHLAMKAAEGLANRAERDVLRAAWRGATEETGIVGASTRPTNALNDPEFKIGFAVDIDAVSASPWGAADFITAASACAQNFDEKDVPDNDDRVLWVRPAEYYLLTSQGNDLIDVNFNPGSKSNIQRAVLDRVSNLIITKNNNWKSIAGRDERDVTGFLGSGRIPIATGQGDVDMEPGYGSDLRQAVALVTRPGLVGTVHLRGITPERGYDMRAQGDLILAKLFKGVNALRPEDGAVIYDGAIATP